MRKKSVLFSLLFLVSSAVIFAQSDADSTSQLLPIKLGGKAGYIDRNGNVVVKPQFNRAWTFSGRRALVEISKRRRGNEPVTGYVEKGGTLTMVEGAGFYSEGVAVVGLGDKRRIVDEEGKLLANLSSKIVWTDQRFSDGMIKVQVRDCIPYQTCGKIGFADLSGRVVINPKFSLADDFYEGLAAVTEGDDEWFFIDKTGREITSQRFKGFSQVTTRFSEGLAGVKVGEKWGFIDRNGKFVIEPRFDGARQFADGLAAVRVGCVWGYIDRAGSFKIEPQFRHALEFSEGLAAVDPVKPLAGTNCPPLGSHSKMGYINKSGKLAIPAQFDLAFPFARGIAEIVVVNPKNQNDLKYGYIDSDGNYIWKPSS